LVYPLPPSKNLRANTEIMATSLTLSSSFFLSMPQV
jgi:hypothetical protein